MKNAPCGHVTFLFTDIEGSTQLAQKFPAEIHDLITRHHSIVSSALEARNGFLFKSDGDSFCCAFENPEDAVMAAVESQTRLSNEHWGDAPIKVRMGIHSGDAEWGTDTYMGYLTLARTARIMSATYGEQILMSGDAYDNLNKSLNSNRLSGIEENSISFRDLGERRLKDVFQPIRLLQVIAPMLRIDFPPLKTLDARPNNLPVQMTSFIGREEVIRTIKELIRQTSLLTIIGTGGAGKTRVALQVAADMIDEFENGVWFVDLSGISEPKFLPNAVLNVFNLKEEKHQPKEVTLCDHFRNMEMLIIFDNCEHLIEGCAAMTEILLSNCPKLKILATSRESLRCYGEFTFRLESLKVPDPDKNESPEKLTMYESVRLFVERALALNKDFRVNNDNAMSLARICYQLDGIPLAIELAVARIKILSVQKICEKLNDRFNLLTQGKRTSLQRQQTLRALIDWSYDLLSEKEKLLFNRLSVFTGGWNLEAAEAICSDVKLFNNEILELTDHLNEKSLLIFDSEKERYRILETLRMYGKEKLKENPDECRIMLSKHLKYFTDFAEYGELKLKGSEEKLWLEKFEEDHGNIQSAIEWSVKEGESEAGVRIAGAMQLFWGIRGHLTVGKHLLETTLVNSSMVSKSVLGKAKSRLGSQLIYLGEFDKAKNYLEEGLSLLREAEDKNIIKDTLNSLGNVYSYLGDYNTARDLFEENLSLGRSTGDKHIVAISLNNLGNKDYVEGNYESARELYEESLSIRREMGNKQGVAIALYNLGNIAFDMGDFAKCKKLFEESLIVSRDIGDKRMIASALNCLGGVATFQGEFDTAKNLIDESLELNREIGEKRNIARSLSFLGRLEQNIGNFDVALNIFNETLALTTQIGEKNGIAFALTDIGIVYYLQKNLDSAKRHFMESLEMRKELGEKLAIAISLNDMGYVFYSCGDNSLAKKYFIESIELRTELKEANNIPSSIIGLSGVNLIEDPKRSAILLGAAEAAICSTTTCSGQIEKMLYREISEQLRSILKEEEFIKYVEIGRKMEIEETADLILRNKL